MEDSKTPPSIPYNFPIYVLTSVFLLRVLVSLHRNNHSSMFYRITVQRKFTGQHFRWRPLFIKLKLVALQLCDIRVPSKHFPMKFVKIFRTVFYGALPGYCSCTIILRWCYILGRISICTQRFTTRLRVWKVSKIVSKFWILFLHYRQYMGQTIQEWTKYNLRKTAFKKSA